MSFGCTTVMTSTSSAGPPCAWAPRWCGPVHPVRRRTPAPARPELALDSGALLAAELQTVGDNEVVMWKPRWSAFHRTPLDDHLRRLGVDTVVLAGCNFPNCPRATVFDASQRDYRVVVVEDATSCVTPERLADAVALGVHTLPTETVIRHVSDRSDTQHGSGAAGAPR
jgi:nicotinamidase-related amidase